MPLSRRTTGTTEEEVNARHVLVTRASAPVLQRIRYTAGSEPHLKSNGCSRRAWAKNTTSDLKFCTSGRGVVPGDHRFLAAGERRVIKTVITVRTRAPVFICPTEMRRSKSSDPVSAFTPAKSLLFMAVRYACPPYR